MASEELSDNLGDRVFPNMTMVNHELEDHVKGILSFYSKIVMKDKERTEDHSSPEMSITTAEGKLHGYVWPPGGSKGQQTQRPRFLT